jgi:hypothetical protein
VARFRLAAPQKKARRQRAHLALIDECGLLMTPLAGRIWAPRGRMPELVQTSGTREKVSVAPAVWLTPQRDRLVLYARPLVNSYLDNWYSAAFLEALLGELRGRVIVIWDGGGMHKGDPIRQLLDHFADRLSLERRLPPYAPMLNSVEPLLSGLKWARPSNLGPRNAYELEGRVVTELAAIREDQRFLRTCSMPQTCRFRVHYFPDSE